MSRKCVNNVIVMLSGYMKSGKDTVGEVLCNKFGFKRYAFADVMKDEVAKIYNWDRNLLDTQSFKAQNVTNGTSVRTVRNIIIDYAMAKREENPEYWTIAVVKELQKHKKDIFPVRAVITDWRFPNEWETIKNFFANDFTVHTWRIDRWKEPPLESVSETALDSFAFDYRLSNNCSFDDLSVQIEKMSFSSNLIPLVLTDIDDVLLKWFDRFREYVSKRGYQFRESCPKTWHMYGWLLDDLGKVVSNSNIQELVTEFNHSLEFQNLDPYEGALETMKSFRNSGFTIIAISSCTDDPHAIKKRSKNLKAHFGDIFYKVICLPLCQSKSEVLQQYPKSIWIEDNIQNAIAGAMHGHTTILINRPWNISEQIDHTISSIPLYRACSWNDVITIVNNSK